VGRSSSSGFTLVELAFVLAVLGILVSTAVPAFQLTVRRAQAAEAPLMLEQIVNSQLAYRRDHGTFLACASSGPAIPAGTTTVFDAAADGWRDLGLAAEGPVRFRYRVELDGDSFLAIAEGDLDGDGASSRFSLDGRTLSLSTQDPLE
jgi:prepilin-type N-terminal cleavage/methylation domain-containing protein